jgi:hypothetical protein
VNAELKLEVPLAELRKMVAEQLTAKGQLGTVTPEEVEPVYESDWDTREFVGFVVRRKV